jgi:hypothetical protein
MQKIFRKFKAEKDNLSLLIDEDFPHVGWQMYVWKDQKGIYDTVQNTLEICKEVAFEEWGIPIDIWIEIT